MTLRRQRWKVVFCAGALIVTSWIYVMRLPWGTHHKQQPERREIKPEAPVTNQKQVNKPVQASQLVTVTVNGRLQDRIRALNDKLSALRSNLLKQRDPAEDGGAKFELSEHRRQYSERERPWQYIQNITRVSGFTVVLLPFVLKHKEPYAMTVKQQHMNYIHTEVYPALATEHLLNTLRKENISRDGFQGHQVNTSETLLPAVSALFYSPTARHALWRHRGQASSNDVTYSHLHSQYITIATDAYIDSRGHVITRDVTLDPQSCARTSPAPPGDVSRKPRWGEVFVIAQDYGSAYYHTLIECLPRLAAYLPFLRRHPQVALHVPAAFTPLVEAVTSLLRLRNPLVEGGVRAGVAYLPPGSRCGVGHPVSLQLLSMQYHVGLPRRPRDTVTYIRRGKTRRLRQERALLAFLKHVTVLYGLRLAVFRDDPPPSTNDTARLFHRSVMVIGPHGAGLSNLVFARSATYVVEVMCFHAWETRPRLLPCYRHLAQALRMRHHGLLSRERCRSHASVHMATMRALLRYYIPRAARMKIT